MSSLEFLHKPVHVQVVINILASARNNNEALYLRFKTLSSVIAVKTSKTKKKKICAYIVDRDMFSISSAPTLQLYWAFQYMNNTEFTANQFLLKHCRQRRQTLP